MAALGAAAKAGGVGTAFAQIPGERPMAGSNVRILNPKNKIPVSLIIDDSTCLVNMAHYGIPQFAEIFPDNYKQPWKTLPREIPDSFVRTFGEWSIENGVKGKYSIVPYPACVGWLDRRLPGWSKRELDDSIELVRSLITRNWDIHPEMISHTFVIDTKTGRPYEERSERFMENWGWTTGKSADVIADYMRYALTILDNIGLTCEGITTPGGFGQQALPELAQATLQSCRDVFQAEIPHYFRHSFTGDESVAPRVEYASGLDGNDPRCVVSIIGCTGDWFGGWDGLTPGSADKFITEDGRGGRLPEVIGRGEPAVMVCHWPGIYFNGEETGFSFLKETVHRLHATYDTIVWMKLSEISRYWAARELTSLSLNGKTLTIEAPFACPDFTVECGVSSGTPELRLTGETKPLAMAKTPKSLTAGTFYRAKDRAIMCFDLKKGTSIVEFKG